jgi:acyl transferase domain-containing protein
MSNNHNQQTDIAIVGMSALFPGAKDVQALWQNILNKVDSVREAPEEWVRSYFEPNSDKKERIYTTKVGLLGELAKFNPLEFGVPPRSIDGSEPDHFLALKLAKAALQDSGYWDKPFPKDKTGVILGRGANPNRGSATGFQYGLVLDQTMDLLQQLLPQLDGETLASIRSELKDCIPALPPEAGPGQVSNVAVGRIANRLDLKGPSYMIDAACSSSLIAVELAIKELRSGRCDMMLAGGVQGSMPPQIYMLFCQLKALSSNGIRPFDATGDGTILGEGVGFLVLKRLEDAEHDGDRIYAVLKDVGLSSDGKALGLLAPRLEGEVLALERAYTQSGIDPSTVALIEAHGTGIPLGDKTEITALSQVFGSRQRHLPQCGLGSVKSMIGHCIPASGIASLVKTSLALYHKILPPTLCDRLNPELEVEKTPFYINTEVRPWIHGDRDLPRRAGVNAFGFGGINAHALLEEYTTVSEQEHKQLHSQWPQELITFASENHKGLLALIKQVQTYLQSNPETNLADVTYSLATEAVGSFRLATLAKDIADLQQKLAKALEKISDPQCNSLQTRNGIYYTTPAANSTTDQIAFLFPGEGSQYSNMLADLCLYFPQVRRWFDLSDATFKGIWEYLPSQYIFPPPTSLTEAANHLLLEGLYTIDVATETVFTAGMALYELLREFRIKSDVMLGHSTGEYTALVASGTLRVSSLEEQIDCKRNLNRVYKELEATDNVPRGSLLAVGAVKCEIFDSILDKYSGQIYLAMDNCPNQRVLFGSPDAVKQIAQELQAVGGICQELPFDRAYHTPLFTGMGQVLASYYQDLPINAAVTPLYSCATSDIFPTEPDAIRSVAVQQWSTRVRFRETIEKLYAQGVRTFIEVGPSSNLTSFVNDTLGKKDYLAIASNSQRKSGLEQLQTLLGRLFVKNMNLDLSPLYNYRQVSKIDWGNRDRSDNKIQKAEIVLDLTLPIMSLKPEFAKKIQEKIGQQKQQSSTSEATSQSVVEPKVSTPPPSVPQKKTILSPPPPTPIVKDFRNSLVASHNQLMQEFLANQARIAEAYFGSYHDSDRETDSSRET